MRQQPKRPEQTPQPEVMDTSTARTEGHEASMINCCKFAVTKRKKTSSLGIKILKEKSIRTLILDEKRVRSTAKQTDKTKSAYQEPIKKMYLG